MISNLRQVTRKDKVSSYDNRQMDLKIQSALSNTYHRLLSLIGRTRTLSSCLAITNEAMSSLYRDMQTSDSSTVSITAASTPTYPSVLGDEEKAEALPGFGVILAKRTNTELVFTDESDNIRPTIGLARATLAADYTVSAVVENSTESILKGSDPYLARFVHAENEVDLQIDITSSDIPLDINALKYIPMPTAGGVSLSSLKYTGANNVVLNGGEELPEKEGYTHDRSFSGYIHFRPVNTHLIRMKLHSSLRVESLECITIGISKIIGEYNTYASRSYIGYEVDAPSGTSTLTQIGVYADNFAASVDNVRVKVYRTSSDFDAANDNYYTACSHVQETNVPLSGSKVYLLVEIDSEHSTTPCIGKIEARFS